MSGKLKIVIAETSEIIREGILSILKREPLHIHIYEINEIDRLKNALILQKPDVFIVNPSLLGLFSLQQLKKESSNPGMRCVAVISDLSDPSILRQYDEVLNLYDKPEHIREKLNRLLQEPQEDKRHESLSQREKEVIACIIKGMTNKQIADKLCISTHTVITHRRNIASKLDIHSAAGLTIYAIVNKLVDLDDVRENSTK